MRITCIIAYGALYFESTISIPMMDHFVIFNAMVAGIERILHNDNYKDDINI